MPVSARLLEVGGIALFWGFEVLIVAGAAAVLIAAARKVREEDHRLSRLTFRLTLVAVQAVSGFPPAPAPPQPFPPAPLPGQGFFLPPAPPPPPLPPPG